MSKLRDLLARHSTDALGRRGGATTTRWLFRLKLWLLRRPRTYREAGLAEKPMGFWPLDDPPEHDPIVWDHSGNERHGRSRDGPA
jgi:hypothetical protein